MYWPKVVNLNDAINSFNDDSISDLFLGIVNLLNNTNNTPQNYEINGKTYDIDEILELATGLLERRINDVERRNRHKANKAAKLKGQSKPTNLNESEQTNSEKPTESTETKNTNKGRRRKKK